jgi:Transmembrane amino acid transporter protein
MRTLLMKMEFKDVTIAFVSMFTDSDISAHEQNYLPTTPMTPNTKAFATGDINIRGGELAFSPNMDRRNFYKRAFGKLEKGSLRGSIFALCASAIGSGVLSLPYVLRLNGWVLGVVFILVGAFGKNNNLYNIYSCCM